MIIPVLLAGGAGNRLWPLSRVLAFRGAAMLTRQARLTENARIWSEVWHQRREWQNGFAASDHSKGGS